MGNNLRLRSSQAGAMGFSIIFSSDQTNGTMASWETELSPSQFASTQPAVFPCDRHLRGIAGVAEIETDQGKFELHPGGSTFIPSGTHALIRCKDRERVLFATVATPGGSEAFFETLGFTSDENEIEEQAKAFGISMFWTESEPDLPPCLQRVVAAVVYPQGAYFSL